MLIVVRAQSINALKPRTNIMAKAKVGNLPTGYGKKGVQLITYDKDTDTTKAYMKDNTVWHYDGATSVWAKQDVPPVPEAGGSNATTDAAKSGDTATVQTLPAEDGKAAATVIDQTAMAEENAELKARLHKAEGELARRDMSALAAKKSAHEGSGKRNDEPAPTPAPTPMAGHLPADVSLIPTADELNARSGQPMSSPRPDDTGQRPLDGPK